MSRGLDGGRVVDGRVSPDGCGRRRTAGIDLQPIQQLRQSMVWIEIPVREVSGDTWIGPENDFGGRRLELRVKGGTPGKKSPRKDRHPPGLVRLGHGVEGGPQRVLQVAVLPLDRSQALGRVPGRVGDDGPQLVVELLPNL